MVVHAPAASPATPPISGFRALLFVPMATPNSSSSTTMCAGPKCPCAAPRNFRFVCLDCDGSPVPHLRLRAIPSICPPAYISSGPSTFVLPALRCATAPHSSSRISSLGVETFYFEALPGIAPEFAFDATTVRTVKASGEEAVTDSGVLYVTGIKAGISSSIDVVSAEGKSRASSCSRQARQKTHGNCASPAAITCSLLPRTFSPAPMFAPNPSGCTPSPIRTSNSRSRPHPLCSRPAYRSSPPPRSNAAFTVDVPLWHAALQSTEVQPDAEAPPVKAGPAQDWRPHGVAQAPAAGELPASCAMVDHRSRRRAQRTQRALPRGHLRGRSARLAQSPSLDDDFYNGEPWSVGLDASSRPTAPELRSQHLPCAKTRRCTSSFPCLSSLGRTARSTISTASVWFPSTSLRSRQATT